MVVRAPEQEDDPALMPGALLPPGNAARFRILRQLGEGGMGVVYEALDLEHNVRVALKTLRATNAHTLYRFKQEFRALAEIVHPRLVPLFDLVADGERWFFTMELIEDGIDLFSWVRGITPRAFGQESLEFSFIPARSGMRRATDVTVAAAPEAAAPGVGASPAAPPSAPTTVGRKVGAAMRALEDLEHAGPASPASPAAATVQDFAPEDRPSSRPVGPGRKPIDYVRLRAAFTQLAEGVQVLHSAGRLHRDLKPENVFVRSESGEVVLLDFGLVAALEAPRIGGVLSSRPPAPLPSHVGEISFDTDSDSLTYRATQAGVIAGTMSYMAPEQAMALPLTAAADWYAVGVMLFEALTSRLPYHGNAAQILMAKQNIDAQSPQALVAETPSDLAALCLGLLCREPAVRPSGPEVIARLSGSTRQKPQPEALAPVFIGRAEQLLSLERAFELSARGSVVVHAHGRSGAGKSVLLERFLFELAERPDTLVVTGRCYEQEFIPFKAIDGIVDVLTRYLLRCPADELAALLPADAALLARVFPVIGRLLGDTSVRAAETDLQVVRQRAFAAMRELLGKLAQRVRLVLVIDDLQWGDIDSVQLLAELLRAPHAPKLLLLLAYRSEQRADNACLRAMAAASKAACAPDREVIIDVGELGPEDARQLTTTLLGSAASPATVEQVLQQAAGSAFLIRELAEHVGAGGELRAAEGLGLDDILWKRAQHLDNESLRLLRVVSVAGRPVRLRHAQLAAGIVALDPRVVSRLRAERLVRTDGIGAAMQIETFHDRVRESIVAHGEASENASQATALAYVLEAEDDYDPETLAALFEQAGHLAKASGYYAEAVPRAVAALAFERAEVLARKAIALAKSDDERAIAYEAAIHFHTDMARFADAYALTREGCGALGIELPAKFVPPLLIADFAAAQLKLIGRKPMDLLELPTMPEGRLQLAARLANAGAKAAFQVRPELCVAVCTKIVRLCLTHGNSPDCAISYMVFGAIFQGGIMGRYKVGYELGQLALALVDKYQNERQRAEVSFVVGYFGISWLRPATEAEALWVKALAAGRASGDLFHVGCAIAGRMMSLQMRGAALSRIESDAAELCELLTRNGLREPLSVLSAVRQASRDLRGATRAPGTWNDASYEEAPEAERWASFGARHFGHYCALARAQTAYLWDHLDDAERALQAATKLAPESKGMLHSAEQLFIEALIAAARGAMPSSSRAQRFVAQRTLKRAASKLRAWAKLSPHNFAHKAALLEAHKLRLAGRQADALAACTEAATSAATFGYTHVEALAQRLAFALHAAAGRTHEAERERVAAVASLQRWGASALAEHYAHA